MAITKIPFTPGDHDQFVQLRNQLHQEKRLGGSDIGTANGQNKWKSRSRFYEEMIGAVQVPDISSKQSIKDGVRCEDMVAKMFEERSGKSVHRVNAILVSDEAPHLFASIDRKVENEDAGLECKTANARNEDAFSDGKLPDSYIKQIKTYMKVTGYRTWYAYVWVMGVAEYCYIFTLDPIEKPEWCDTLVEITEMELDECEDIAARWFSDHIDPKVAPDTDGSDDESKLIKEMFPESTDSDPIELKTIDEEKLMLLGNLKDEAKTIESKIGEIENAIKIEMGSHAEAIVGSRKITWKNNKPSSKTDYKAAAAEAKVSDEILAKFTTITPGARVLRVGKAK